MNAVEKIANNIDLKEYQYGLPDSKIAKYPLDNRSESNLLVYKSGNINHQKFYQIDKHLPKESLLIFNNTKVIPARLHFQKSSGAKIEIFLLSPKTPFVEVSQAMAAKEDCSWLCMVGNKKKWKVDTSLERFFETEKGKLKVTASYKDFDTNEIIFQWDNPAISFVDLVELMGTTPLPPYLNRQAEDSDKPRYQTVYSKKEGAVAAPTAGLHFTEDILAKLQDDGHALDYLTLHVSAGTFQPLKSDNVMDHPMHNEQILIELESIQTLAKSDRPIIAVGTTSVRSLESAYWFGVQLLREQKERFFISKLYPYEQMEGDLPSRKMAFQKVLEYMQEKKLATLYGETEIFIFPGYNFKVVNGLITNFHQPESTLVLLIASFIGKDWKKVYNEALENNYRFLSYGDSSLLIP